MFHYLNGTIPLSHIQGTDELLAQAETYNKQHTQQYKNRKKPSSATEGVSLSCDAWLLSLALDHLHNRCALLERLHVIIGVIERGQHFLAADHWFMAD